MEHISTENQPDAPEAPPESLRALNAAIPASLFKALRIRCIEKGIEVRQGVATALRNWLDLES